MQKLKHMWAAPCENPALGIFFFKKKELIAFRGCSGSAECPVNISRSYLLSFLSISCFF